MRLQFLSFYSDNYGVSSHLHLPLGDTFLPISYLSLFPPSLGEMWDPLTPTLRQVHRSLFSWCTFRAMKETAEQESTILRNEFRLQVPVDDIVVSVVVGCPAV